MLFLQAGTKKPKMNNDAIKMITFIFTSQKLIIRRAFVDPRGHIGQLGRAQSKTAAFRHLRCTSAGKPEVKGAGVRVSRRHIIGSAGTGVGGRHIDNGGIKIGLRRGIGLETRIVAISAGIGRDIGCIYVSEGDFRRRAGGG